MRELKTVLSGYSSRASWVVVGSTIVILCVVAAWLFKIGVDHVDWERRQVEGRMREAVNLAMAYAQPDMTASGHGGLNREQTLAHIAEVVSNVNASSALGDNYLFMGTLAGRPLVDPAGLASASPAEMPNTRAMAVVAEFARGHPDGGFLEYDLQRADRREVLRKRSYVRVAPQMGFFLGTGVPVETLEKPRKEFFQHAAFLALLALGLCVLPSIFALRELEKRNRTLAEEVERRREAQQALAGSQERLKVAMESNSDGIFEWDINSGSVDISNKFYNILGWPEHSGGLEMDFLIGRLHPEDAGRFTDVAADYAANKCISSESEYRVRDGDGKWRWFLVTSQVSVRDGHGMAKRVVGTFTDINEKKRHQLEHQKLNEQLRRTQKMEAVGTLAGGIAHEFNNILTVILGFSQVALRNARKGTVPERELGEVIDAAARARDLVKQLLTFSRQAGTEKVELDVRPLVKESVRFLRSSLPANVEIIDEIDSDPLFIHANGGQIHQMLVNLINNAAQAMAPGGGKVWVRLHQVENTDACAGLEDAQSHGCVKLVIEDMGPGVDSDLVDRIFEPFFTTRGVGEGSGLGLAVVHGIVSEHGGAIGMSNKPDHGGAVFEVMLPLARAVATPVFSQEAAAVVPGRGNLVLVEDDDEVLEVSAAMLEGLGYHVRQFRDAGRAWDYLRLNANACDLLISDQEMPAMTGLELIARARSVRSGMPGLVVTGAGTGALGEAARLAGVAGVLVKPFSMSELSKAVAAAMAQGR